MRRGHAFPESRRSKSMEDLMTARILLVEDDPTTCAFLAAAAQGVPAEVDVAGSCAAALALAGDRDRHDLWLIDANLDRKSVGEGKSVSVRVDLGGSRIIKQKNRQLKETRTQETKKTP